MHDLIQIRQDHSKIMPRYVSKSWQDLGMICNKILAWSLAKILLRSSDRDMRVHSKQLINLPKHALDNLALVECISNGPHMCERQCL